MASQLEDLNVNDRIIRLKEMFTRLNTKVASTPETRQMKPMNMEDSSVAYAHADLDHYLDFKFQEDNTQVECFSEHSQDSYDDSREVSQEFSHPTSPDDLTSRVSPISRALTQQCYARTSISDSETYSPESRVRLADEDSEEENSFISPRFPSSQSTLISSVYLQLDKEKRTVEGLKKSLHHKGAQLSELKAEKADLMIGMESCWDDHQDRQRDSSLLEQQLHALKLKEKRLRTENEQLKEQLARQEEERSMLENEGKYRQHSNSSEASFNQLEQQYKASLEETEELRSRNVQLQERIRGLMVVRDQQENELQTLKSREKHQSEEVLRMQKDRLQLREELELARQTAYTHQVDLQRAESELQHDKLELERLSGLAASQRSRLKQLEFEVEGLKNELKSHQTRLTWKDELSPFKRDVARQDYEITRLPTAHHRRTSPKKSPVKPGIPRSPESHKPLKELQSHATLTTRSSHRRSMSQPDINLAVLKECGAENLEDLGASYKGLQVYVKQLKKFEKLAVRLDQLVRECSPADSLKPMSTRLIWKWVRRVVEHYMSAAKYKDISEHISKLLGMFDLVHPTELPRHVARLLSENTLMSGVVEKVKKYCKLSPFTSLKEVDCTLDYKLQLVC
jgi:hypothetical protein